MDGPCLRCFSPRPRILSKASTESTSNTFLPLFFLNTELRPIFGIGRESQILTVWGSLLISERQNGTKFAYANRQVPAIQQPIEATDQENGRQTQGSEREGAGRAGCCQRASPLHQEGGCALCCTRFLVLSPYPVGYSHDLGKEPPRLLRFALAESGHA